MRKPGNWFKKNKGKEAMTEDLKDQEIQDQQTANEQEGSTETSAENNNEIEVEVADSEEVSELGSLEEAMEVIAGLQLKLRTTEAELATEKEQVLRLNADFINFRNRKNKEMADTVRFANQDLLKQILPILDDFDRTFKAIESTDNLSAIKEGLAMVTNSFQKRLTKIGLEPIESVGKEFDSELHEAITTIPVEDEAQKGQVVDEVEKGYKLKDKVIRFSKVVVGE